MSEKIRLGNIYYHDEYGDVLTVYRDHENQVWFRDVLSRDNGGAIQTGQEIRTASYSDFLGSCSMRDYPDDWERKARAIKQRDDHTCQGCGTSPRDFSDSESDGSPRGCGDDESELHAHHIVPLGCGGSNAMSNLITLCETCHGRVHAGST
jgi:hypothetical protein